ncbi:MAG: undecaprenyldiphospho-muramoylpentapeptide beta-N-acetylglucosaminyltransferase [Candidatus Brocadia sinica]|uniref:UDP-N-acetylglucosamine--N-acetylmuramyl-(pentapeptide) pyrophosphoryl-undecaprenol N-acetylglucosamine transferase n=1 Tax=Candidatus Brocadia sinica JPN1 TaxID=1197129 RepID=A0ABQ0K1M7_9BACT|nr:MULTISPECIES: undecaprenyldiphospho-muramoylpentapeptide beta-N-acetylglucosaminyltransferase [Brocadia]MCK6468727.1 undecaprenyldiphospho-muramoylpentapeptide beta-N-acetylglucosaminyltransferase [Candidatus Brocadia sinica]NOG42739.1 undecaprenyldiphospho-muramoylpentapeptide beta-N-acetylglucosaminyltransferase [Planctomycetota bacterium]NUO05031.1 undecaprenyldiphospho-muramoylpentapeptide beta-N-acetylglucosaminyltransferase [Candidatus Brocadia sinica]GAN34958.1 UDP-N-acetylglucosamine
MKVIFAGGGTGGHLMVGLSTAEEICSRFHEAEIIFLGTGKKFEKRCVEQKGFQYQQLRAKKWGKSYKYIFTFIGTMLASIVESLFVMRKFNPDIVVGLGGYVSVAPIVAAKLLGIPSVLLEQNVIPGKANRFLARWVDEVYCHWRGPIKWFNKAKVVRVTGTPIRKDILFSKRSRSAEKFGLSSSKKTILIMGGSQGAQAINEVIVKSLPKLETLSDDLQIIHCTGDYGYEAAKAAYAQTKIDAFVCSFLDDMGAAFSMTDIIVCRAGATTIAEITAIGIPAILIPYPHATDNHQYWNAMELVSNGGGYLVQQLDLTPEKIAELVTDLFYNKEKYDRMKMFNRGMGIPNASVNVVDNICRVIGLKSTQFALIVG